MLSRKLNRFGSTIHTFEWHPFKNSSQIVKSPTGKRQPLANFRHAWFESRGSKIAAKINLGFFQLNDALSLHNGLLARDSGFVEGVPNNGYEMWLNKDGKFNVAQLASLGVQGIGNDWTWGSSLAFSLVLNGQKKLDATHGFNWTGEVQRTAFGSKSDGTLVAVVAEKLTGNELADVMLTLGCINALAGDGGGSSQMIVEDQYIMKGREIGTALVVFAKEDERVTFLDESNRTNPIPSQKETTRIIIDAGHGSETPGKRSPDSSGLLREFHFNLPVANEIISLLSEYENVELLTTYDPAGRDIPLAERIDKIVNWGKSDVLVSIHANAFGSTWNSANGIETYTDRDQSTKSVKLAEAVQANLIQATGRRNRGVKEADFMIIYGNLAKKLFLRDYVRARILVECGFMTHREEAALLKSKDYQRKCAAAIVKAIVDTYNIEKMKNNLYRVQVEVFGNKPDAERLSEQLKHQGYPAFIVPRGSLYRIQVGAFQIRSYAEKLANELRTKGFASLIV